LRPERPRGLGLLDFPTRLGGALGQDPVPLGLDVAAVLFGLGRGGGDLGGRLGAHPLQLLPRGAFGGHGPAPAPQCR